MDATTFAKFIADTKAALPVETKIVHKVFKALKAAGTPVVRVFESTGEVDEKVRTMAEMDAVAFNLDECYLATERGAWVRIVMGNGWDALVDYTVNLEDALQPVNDYIDARN